MIPPLFYVPAQNHRRCHRCDHGGVTVQRIAYRFEQLCWIEILVVGTTVEGFGKRGVGAIRGLIEGGEWSDVIRAVGILKAYAARIARIHFSGDLNLSPERLKLNVTTRVQKRNKWFKLTVSVSPEGSARCVRPREN